MNELISLVIIITSIWYLVQMICFFYFLAEDEIYSRREFWSWLVPFVPLIRWMIRKYREI